MHALGICSHSHQLPLNLTKYMNISVVRFDICDPHSKKPKPSAEQVTHRQRICSFLFDPFNDVLFNLRWWRAQSLSDSSNDCSADLRQQCRKESELIKRVCYLFPKRPDIEFLFPLNYLSACPLIHMTASRSQQETWSKESQLNPLNWLSCLARSGTHTHTHPWHPAITGLWCDIKGMEAFRLNILHLKLASLHNE